MQLLAINIKDTLDELQGKYEMNSGFSSEGLPEGKFPTPESTYYNLVLYFLWIAGILAFMVLIYGGILYITSAGVAEQTERAKKTIIGAIIGIIIIAASYSAYNFILAPLT